MGSNAALCTYVNIGVVFRIRVVKRGEVVPPPSTSLALYCATIREKVCFGHILWGIEIHGAAIEIYEILTPHAVLCSNTKD